MSVEVIKSEAVVNLEQQLQSAMTAPVASEKGSQYAHNVPSEEMIRIVDGVKANDENAATDLYKLVYRFRYRFTRYLAASDVEDMIQETFMVLFRAIREDRITHPERLLGFLKVVSIRKTSIMIQQEQKDRNRMTSIEEHSDTMMFPKSHLASKLKEVTDQFERTGDSAIIQRALKTLNPRESEILTRFYLQEQDEEQICVEMGLTPGQYRNTKSKAKLKLEAFAQNGAKRAALRRTVNTTEAVENISAKRPAVRGGFSQRPSVGLLTANGRTQTLSKWAQELAVTTTTLRDVYFATNSDGFELYVRNRMDTKKSRKQDKQQAQIIAFPVAPKAPTMPNLAELPLAS
jgi:RNA polymerase sigma factor (sigma-70 family)